MVHAATSRALDDAVAVARLVAPGNRVRLVRRVRLLGNHASARVDGWHGDVIASVCAESEEKKLQFMYMQFELRVIGVSL